MARLRDSKSRRHYINLKGMRELEDSLQALYRIKANVGILDNKKAAKYMAKQEYGHYWEEKKVWVPARPFFRLTLEKLGEVIYKKMGRQLARMVGERSQRPTFASIEKIIIQAAARLKKGLKETIQEHVPPPLAKITVKEKKKKKYAAPETPLYRTGTAYKAIKYKIVKTNPE